MTNEKVLIVAGEASGELYGALLCRELKKLLPNIEMFGMGGSRMKAEGVQIMAGITGSHGAKEPIKLYTTLFKNAHDMLRHAQAVRPHLAVLIDFPDFNIRFAKKVKALGIPILYYVSPTVWAWRQGRAKTISELANAIALIFPFEEVYYKPYPIQSEFVGHPVLDYHAQHVPPGSMTPEEARKALGLNPEKKTVALFPGSRRTEIQLLLPVLIACSNILKQRYPDMQFIIPVAPDVELNVNEPGVVLIKGRVGETLSASDAAVIASGTAGLEACLFNTPQVMIYKVGFISYLLGRLILKVKYLSHVNIILDKPIVPELIERQADPKKIANAVIKLLDDSAYRQKTLDAYAQVQKAFGPPGASFKTAQIAAAGAGWKLP
jgi:lipid-A-disaccharide synthase